MFAWSAACLLLRPHYALITRNSRLLTCFHDIKTKSEKHKSHAGRDHPVLPLIFSSSSSKSILLGCHKGMAMICVQIGRWVAELTRSHPLPWWQKCGSISNNRRSIPESILRYHCSVLSLSDSFFSFSHSLIVKHTCQYANWYQQK